MKKCTLKIAGIVWMISLFILTSGANAYASTTTTRTWTDVAYASTSTTQKLDIFLPSTGDGPFPVVIWIHGGAFKMGNKDNPQSKTALNTAGFAVVSINYRLSTEAKWPAQLEDLQAVVTFLKTNASTYSLNPDKMGSWGASAGGHLSAMMGTALATDPATRIQACVDWFGPVDFYNMDADIALSGVSRCTGANGDASSPESALIGVQVSTHQAESDNASPVAKAKALDAATAVPSFLIMHGGQDCNIGANQSVRLHTAITDKFGSAKSTYIFLQNATHGGGDFTLASTEKTVVDFFIAKLMTTTGIDPLATTAKCFVYPNPATDVLYVQYEAQSNQKIMFEIINMNGCVQKSGILTNSQINVDGLKGMFFLRLKSAGKIICAEKIIVK